MTASRTVTIHEVNQSEAAWHREVTIGSKVFETPGQFVRVESQSDLKAIIGQPQLEGLPAGIVARFLEHDLLPPIRAKQQRFVDEGVALAGQDYDLVRGNVPILLDPATDVLRHGSEKDREAYADLPELPQFIVEAANERGTEKHNPWWNRVRSQRLLLKAQLWASRFQTRQQADLILPFAPYIDGIQSGIVQVAIEANQTMRQAAHDEDAGTEVAAYYALHPRAFLDRACFIPLMEGIREALHSDDPPKVVLFKLSSDDGNKALANHHARWFFSELNALKEWAKLQGRPFVVIVMAGGGRGPPLVFGGADAFIETYAPMTDFPRISKGGPTTNMGGYYHPGPQFQDFVPYEHMEMLYQANGRALPCACRVCVGIGNRGLPTEPAEWNTLRRIHFLNARKHQCEMFRRHIDNGTAMEAIDWIGRGNNPQHGNWLPRRFV